MSSKIKSKKIRDSLSTAIRKRRNKLRLSQEEIAYKAGIDRSYLSEIECGKVAVSVEVAYLIAKALKTSLTSIVKEIEKTNYFN